MPLDDGAGQERYDAVNAGFLCHISFEFRDGSALRRCFTYDWRHYSLSELRDILLDAGFASVDAYPRLPVSGIPSDRDAASGRIKERSLASGRRVQKGGLDAVHVLALMHGRLVRSPAAPRLDHIAGLPHSNERAVLVKDPFLAGKRVSQGEGSV